MPIKKNKVIKPVKKVSQEARLQNRLKKITNPNESIKPEKPIQKKSKKVKNLKKHPVKSYPSLKLESDRDIAMNFAQRLYKTFDKLIKAVVLFGSAAKQTNVLGSDIDIIIIVDDASIRFNEATILWYRENLGKIIQQNPYKKDLHITTVKLTTWWKDLTMGDPTVINVIRYGDTLLDIGGFFTPLKILLQEGRIKSTPEAIYTALNRVPTHIRRSKSAEISAIEGSYWAMVDTSQALLMSIRISPPSPEHIIELLNTHFVEKGLLKKKYVKQFEELHHLHKDAMHGEIRDIRGDIIDSLQDNAEAYLKICLKLIKEIIN